MGLEYLINLNKEIIERRAEELKGEICQRLDEQANNLKAQLENLAALPIPEDLIATMVHNRARIWVSKVVGIPSRDSLKVQNGARLLFYETSRSREPSFQLDPGAYKLVLFAIPQEAKLDARDGSFTDEYDQRMHFDD